VDNARGQVTSPSCQAPRECDSISQRVRLKDSSARVPQRVRLKDNASVYKTQRVRLKEKPLPLRGNYRARRPSTHAQSARSGYDPVLSRSARVRAPPSLHASPLCKVCVWGRGLCMVVCIWVGGSYLRLIDLYLRLIDGKRTCARGGESGGSARASPRPLPLPS